MATIYLIVAHGIGAMATGQLSISERLKTFATSRHGVRFKSDLSKFSHCHNNREVIRKVSINYVNTWTVFRNIAMCFLHS